MGLAFSSYLFEKEGRSKTPTVGKRRFVVLEFSSINILGVDSVLYDRKEEIKEPIIISPTENQTRNFTKGRSYSQHQHFPEWIWP